MLWLIRIVVSLCVLVGLVLAVSFVVAPPKNFGGGLRPPTAVSGQGTGAAAGGRYSGQLPSNELPLNADNVVPLGATIIHTPKGPAQRAYTTRGRIDALPGEKAGYLMIHHARIDDFLNRKGEVVGMEEMIMEFPAVVPGVRLDGLAVGDPVEVTFEVRWDDEPVWVITKLVELSPEAELGLASKD
jgi:hypothetical protein